MQQHFCKDLSLVLVFQSYAYFRITMSLNYFLQSNSFLSKIYWPLAFYFSGAAKIPIYFPRFQTSVLPKNFVLVNDISMLVRSTKFKFEMKSKLQCNLRSDQSTSWLHRIKMLIMKTFKITKKAIRKRMTIIYCFM